MCQLCLSKSGEKNLKSTNDFTCAYPYNNNSPLQKKRKKKLHSPLSFIQFYIVLKLKYQAYFHQYYLFYYLLLDCYIFMDTDNVVLKTGGIGNPESRKELKASSNVNVICHIF